MWKRGGRSSALDRAQALLSAKRSSRGDIEAVQGSAEHTGVVGASVKTRSASPNTIPLLSDLSDLSSVSSAPQRGADSMVPATAAAAAGGTQGREAHYTKDLTPQSSLGGGGSRFLKKAPPAPTNSSQSPVSKGQKQQAPEHRCVSSSQRGSQAAALSKLAQIESRIRSRKQLQEQSRQGPLTSNLGISPPLPAEPAAQSLEGPVQLFPQSSSDQSLKGKRFLKNKTAVAVNDSNAAVRSSDVGVRSRSRAAAPSAVLEAKSVRVVSLESDEEDMRKLLGDSLDSSDNSFLTPGRPSSRRAADKVLSKSRQQIRSSPPPAAAPPSSSSTTAPRRSPTSPSHRGSPFRFTGQPQAHFSPSVLSPCPSPPRGSPSPPGRAERPQRSASSVSGRGEVLSLEELFSAGDPHSEMSAVTSEDFRINVMTLDDLGFTEETSGKEREVKPSDPPPGSLNRHEQLPRLKEKEKREQQQEEEEALDYQSDFESGSRTEPDYSLSQVSEHLQGAGDEEEEEVAEVREEVSDESRGRTDDDYSSTFSDTSPSCSSRPSHRSPTLSRSRDSRSSPSPDSRTSSRQSRRRASSRKVLKEAAVQTRSDPLAYTRPSGMATSGPAVGMAFMDPTPVAAHTLSAEILAALSSANPAVFALNEMMKQQLAMTRRFMESSRHLHSSLLQSLGPPSYRYTTLEDTKEYIRKHRPRKLTMEEALEEVLQERPASYLTTGTDCH